MTRLQHRILVATDGSRPADAAVGAAVRFPWAEPSSACVVVAQAPLLPPASSDDRRAMEQAYRAAADRAREMLAKRWSAVEAAIVDDAPASAILSQAKRFGATTVVLGWRGHGKFRRLLAGSVARIVAARAPCPVLIVRAPVRSVRRLVVGYDGSANAERAIDFITSLQTPPNQRVHIVTVVEPVPMPASVSLLPSSVRAQIRNEVSALNGERRVKAEESSALVVRRLRAAGWNAFADVRAGEPLVSLLSAASEYRADILILGARATSGIERALLGSVANGAVNRARMPVLLVR